MELVKKSTLIKDVQKEDKLYEYLNALDNDIRNIVTFSQSKVRFGTVADGNKGENISGQWQVVADTGSADTEFAVTHTVGAVPQGYIVTKIDKGGVVYDSGTTWTSTNVYLKCSADNAAVELFLLK